jgi:hypothetical protein
MSATLQKDTCYFSHDANAKDDYKCMLLIDQMGLEGYGIFWVLVETLREQKDYKYPLQLVPSLARKYNTTNAKMETVINAYGLFEIDAQSFFFSGSLNRRMNFLEQKREKIVAASLKGVEAKKAKKQQLLELSGYNSTNHRLTDGQPSKEKESKEKEKKENKTLSRESDIFKNLQSFKSHFISKNTNVPFYTQGIGYEVSTPFKINESGYITNTISGKILTADEAFKVWEYLFNFYLNQKIGA